LANLVDFPPRDAVEKFIRTTGFQSMHRVEQELEEQGWQAEVTFDEQNCRAQFQVFQEGKLEFIYEIRLRGYAMPDFAFPESASPDETNDDEHYYRAEVFLRRGGQAYDVYGYDQQDIITDILDQFEKYLHFLHISPGILPWKMEEHDDDLISNDEPAEGEASATPAADKPV
ncbi:MAG: choline transporter, partial [Aeromonadales bacterium]|nr:choline transporter [Aeromonadales bacterium]